MGVERVVPTSRILAEAAAQERATSPQAAGPDDATICPTYGWTGWTVDLPAPPRARPALRHTTGLVRALFQAMVDHLGVGDKAAVPDVNQVLRTTGLDDTIDKSLVATAHNATVDKIRGVTQGLVSRHRDIAAKVADAATMGTELNREIWDEVCELRSALHAVGTGPLSTSVEVGLIERLRTSLRKIAKKYEAVAGTNESTGDAIGPLTLNDLKALVPKTNSAAGIASVPDATLAKYLPYLNKAMLSAEITTPDREAAFLAQVLHETAGLRTLDEYGDRAYFDNNYGPQTAVGRSLGNTHPGDGSRYHGRGALQLTGRSNYEAAGKAIGIDLVAHPDKADDPDHAFDTAAWYWENKDLNKVLEKKGFDEVTHRVNGGSIGAHERHRLYDKARDVLDAD